MSFEVRELPRAKADVRAIFAWLTERSPQGAKAWLDAYDDALVRLKSHAGALGIAIENRDCPKFEVHQILFRVRRRRVYRALYFIDDSTAYVLRVRGPGQAPVDPDDID